MSIHLILRCALFLSAALCVSCETASQSQRELSSQFVVEYNDNEFRKGWFEALRVELDENPDVHVDGHKKITVIIHPTFDDVLFIAIEKRPAMQFHRSETYVEHLRAITELQVSTYSISSRNEGKMIEHWYNDIRHKKIVKEHYSKPIDDEHFQKIYDRIIISSASVEKNSNVPNGCTDGTISFVELLDGHNRRLISRHDCDPDYKVIFEIIKPLFEAAINDIDFTATIVRAAWRAETKTKIDTAN